MRIALYAFAAVAAALAHPAGAGSETPWVEAYQSRTRMLSGAGTEPGSYVAGFEIEMPKGWKTYWRSPGDSGLAPEFDWTASANLASAETLYPAPKSYADAGGVTIGYAERVIFPIAARAADPNLPITLKGVVRYGVCKDICVPAETAVEIELKPGMAPPPEDLSKAVERVPRLAGDARPGDPKLIDSRVEKNGDDRRLVFRAVFPGGLDGAEAFLEGPGGAYLPLPARVSENGEEATFAADVGASGVLTPAGQTAAVTLVGPLGQSTAQIKLD